MIEELENSENKERAAEKIKRIGCLAAAVIPLASLRIVVLGQDNFLAQIINFLIFIKSVIGGML